MGRSRHSVLGIIFINECLHHLINTSICISHSPAKSTVAGNCRHGATRLVDLVDDRTTMTRVGRVEVCVNNAWGSVCKNSFNSPEADVVCNLNPGFTGVG